MIDAAKAPFVYFDAAPVYGTLNGAIHVELTANTLHPGSGSSPDLQIVMAGHLRCSPVAAQDLIHALQSALALLGVGVAPPEPREVN